MTSRSRGRKSSASRRMARGGRRPAEAPSPATPPASRRPLRLVAGVVLVAALALLAWAVVRPLARGGGLAIGYPFDGSEFPPEIVAPTLWWTDDSGAGAWRVTIRFEADDATVTADVDTTAWTPDAEQWESIKLRSMESRAVVTVVRRPRVLGLRVPGARDSVAITTSCDSVGAPIFYRDVPLPFRFALRNVPMIKWRLGSVASAEPPPTVLTNLPVCGNCHSFSADGGYLGMDVDLGSDKGAYALTPFEPTTLLSRDRLITWSDFVRGEKVPTFGFLPRVSPDGRFVLAGVKDRAVFLPREDMLFSQIFFPVMGILAYFDRTTRRIEALPGADDERYVQTNGVWTPDGESVIFARSRAAGLSSENASEDIVLTLEESAEVLGGEEYLWKAQEGGNRFRFDLYRMPFNGGRGGEAEPIAGAADNGMSNYFPKVSPDGKWIVFTQAHSFMLLQPDSKLYIMPASGGEPRLMNANTNRMNSWHSWSPNSRWLVFSSKVFGPYTQLMLAHVDENGIDSPPVLLQNFTDEYRAANIPEFVNVPPDAARVIEERFVDDYSYFRSGRIYQQFREFDRAEEEFRRSLEINPANTFSLYSIATMHREQKDWDAALETYREILRTDPGSSIVHGDLGSLYFEMGENAKAETEYRNALKLDPRNFEAGFNLGVVLLAGKRLDEAERAFRGLLDLDLKRSDVNDVRQRLAAIQLMRGDFADAAVSLRAMVASDSTDITARYNLGLAYRSLSRSDEARAQFEAVVRLDTADILARAQLGEMAVEAGDPETALRHFRRVVALDPKNHAALRQIARIHVNAGDPSAAMVALIDVLGVQPDDVWALFNLGMAYYETGQYDRAVAQFKRVVERGPGDPRTWFVLGDALVHEGRSTPEAIAAYERGLAIDSRFAEEHVTLGDLYIRVGNEAGALREFQAAVALSPELAASLQPRIDDLRRRMR